MKNNIFYFLVALLLLPVFGSCANNASQVEVNNQSTGRTLSVNLAPAPELKAIVKDLNSRKIFLQWEEGMFDINIAFHQGETIELVKSVMIKNVKDDMCAFDVEVPEAININEKFDMYGVIAEQIIVEDGKLLVNVGGHMLYELTATSNNKDGYVPMVFLQEDVEMYGKPVSATFDHLGALAVITIKNNDTKPLETAGFAVRPADGTSEFYHKAALPFVGNEELPYMDLLSATSPIVNKMTRVTYPSVVVPSNDVASVGFWFCPITESTPEVKLAMYDIKSRKEVLSTNTRPARATAMESGKAYHIYAEWDGTELTLVKTEPQRPLPANQPVMKFTTSLQKGETLNMTIGGINPQAERDIWIDLNNNGTREKGEYIQEFFDKTLSKNLRPFTIDSQEFAIYGEVSTLVLDNGTLTALDVSKNPNLEQFFTFDGDLKKIDLSNQDKLRRVALENNKASEILLSPNATGLEEIYVSENKLKTFDVSMAANALLIEAGKNELTSIVVPAKFVDLWGFNVEENQLEAEALNAIFDSLSKATNNVYYDWQYSMNLWDNPGVATADLTKLSKKGWRAVTIKPQENGTSQSPKSGNAKYLKTPLK